jgi:serine/threonine-protein kinase
MSDDDLRRRARERLGATLNGKYRLDELLGIGGMAAVYRATHRNRAQLAVKMLHSELSLDVDVRSRFLREAYAANSVQHPGAVVVVDDDVTADGAAFLVMELLDGMTVEELTVRYPGQKVPLPVAVAVVHQLLEVLAAAHAAGVVHRDVKPANLFLTRDGNVKVLDFGIARIVESTRAGAKATGAGMPIGTPAFMAPEQALGRSDEIGPCTDLWAVGATLFTLLSGAVVHDSPSAAETLVRAATRPARSLAEAQPDAPDPIVGVADRALAFERALRWPTAEAMADELARALEQATGAPPSKAILAALFPARPSSLPPARRTSEIPSELASAPTVDASQPTPGDSSMDFATRAPVSNTRGGAAPAKQRRARLAAIAATVVVVLLATVGWRRANVRRHRLAANAAAAAASRSPAMPAAAGPPLVLILAFENRTTDPVFDGTPDLVLDSALKRSPRLYPVAGANARSLIAEVAPKTDPSDERIGRLVLDHLKRPVTTVRGNISPDGSGYQITVRALDAATNAEVVVESLEAETLERVVPTVARFATILRSALGDPPPPEDLEKTGMSASIEADHEFAMGRGELASGRFAVAVSHLERAIAIDPRFAVAQAALGLALVNEGHVAEGEPHLEASVSQKETLSRREQLLHEALYHLARKELDATIAAYEELLAGWPAESLYIGNLATARFAKGDFARALELERKAVLDRPSSVAIRANLSGIELALGDFQAALDDARTALTVSAHPAPQTYAWGALAAGMLGRRAEAVDFHTRLRAADANTATVVEADFAAFEGRLDDAAAALEAGIAADTARKATEEAAAKSAVLGEVRLRQGRTDAARKAATRALAATETVTLYRAARVLGGSGQAARMATMAESLSERPGDQARLTSLLLRAAALRAKGDRAKAADLLRAGGSPKDAWIVHADLGATYADLGAWADAERELTICVSRRGEALNAFLDDSVTGRYLPPVLYQLARAKEALERPDAAAAYQTFLAMEPSSQGDPLVRDAERRARGLARAP